MNLWRSKERSVGSMDCNAYREELLKKIQAMLPERSVALTPFFVGPHDFVPCYKIMVDGRVTKTNLNVEAILDLVNCKMATEEEVLKAIVQSVHPTSGGE